MTAFLPILALDTAAQQCAVALLTASATYERTEPQARGQSERLIPMMLEVLAEAGLTFADLRAVTVTIGPGSFTGLRIGLAAAHGVALAQGVPAIGIDSFAAFNASLPPATGSPRAVIIESRRAELYWCLMTADGTKLTQPACDLPAEIVRHLAGTDAILCGDGMVPIAALMPAAIAIDQTPGPSALAIARLALLQKPQDGLPAAMYVRPPDAKPQELGLPELGPQSNG